LVFLFDMAIEHKGTGVWDKVKLEMPPHEVLVRVTARQFAWTFTYAGVDGKLDTADDFQSTTEMHVPEGKVVRFALESKDVLHSFWIPVLRLKQDAVPGRTINGWFQATQTGDYEIGCAEICGGLHTNMRATMRVESPEDFDRWAATNAAQQAQLLSAQGATAQ